MEEATFFHSLLLSHSPLNLILSVYTHTVCIHTHGVLLLSGAKESTSRAGFTNCATWKKCGLPELLQNFA